MLADTAVLARECAARKVGLAAFNVVLLDHAEAFVQAAETPVCHWSCSCHKTL